MGPSVSLSQEVFFMWRILPARAIKLLVLITSLDGVSSYLLRMTTSSCYRSLQGISIHATIPQPNDIGKKKKTTYEDRLFSHPSMY